MATIKHRIKSGELRDPPMEAAGWDPVGSSPGMWLQAQEVLSSTCCHGAMGFVSCQQPINSAQDLGEREGWE